MPDRRIKDVIAGKEFVAVACDACVREVAGLMRQTHANAVLVVGEGGQALLGICTERDIVIGMVATGRNPDDTKVDEIMTKEPRTLTADKPFCHALHMMYEGGFHHVPIVDEHGRPLGILTARDALNMDVIEFERELIQREEITVVL